MKRRREELRDKAQPYPNQWRALRNLRRLRQRDVAHALGHFNVWYYQDIESGRRFPQARILFLLLALYEVNLAQAYPTLALEAEETLQRLSVPVRRTERVK